METDESASHFGAVWFAFKTIVGKRLQQAILTKLPNIPARTASSIIYRAYMGDDDCRNIIRACGDNFDWQDKAEALENQCT